MTATKLATLGYEGMSSDDFFAVLKANHIQTIVDVRELPLSRKKGFSKRAFSQLATQHGIGYVHLPALGCPRAIRYDYRVDGNWGRYTERFTEYLQTQDEALAELAVMVRQKSCCLVCYEADYQLCHRSFIAQHLVDELDPTLALRHLSAKDREPSGALLPLGDRTVPQSASGQGSDARCP